MLDKIKVQCAWILKLQIVIATSWFNLKSRSGFFLSSNYSFKELQQIFPQDGVKNVISNSIWSAFRGVKWVGLGGFGVGIIGLDT